MVAKGPKDVLHAFALAVALATPPVTQAMNLSSILDLYGFKKAEEKQEIAYLLEKSGIEDVETFLNAPLETKEEQLKGIVEFVELTQKHFVVRKGTQERWEVVPTDWMKSETDQPKILESLKSFGLLEPVLPTFETRDAICILGCTKSGMASRVDYAGQLNADNQLPANRLMVLSGERYVTPNTDMPLDGTEQELLILADKLSKPRDQLTETDMARQVLIETPYFEGMQTVVLDTPRGNLPRPTTETTVMTLVEWLKTHPEVKTMTFVSDQPFVAYQEAMIAMVLKREGSDLAFEVIGPKPRISLDSQPDKLIMHLAGTLGSQIYASTPSLIEQLALHTKDPALKERLMTIYKGQPFVAKAVESYLDKNTVSDSKRMSPR